MLHNFYHSYILVVVIILELMLMSLDPIGPESGSLPVLLCSPKLTKLETKG
jgi:hypothetical protein